MTQMVDASGTSSWTYNGANEVTQLTTPQGTVNYVYKLDGQLKKIQQSGLSDLVYRFDSSGRVDRVTSAFTSMLSRCFRLCRYLAISLMENRCLRIISTKSRR
ncbi:MAG: hypothetical protein K1X67_18135 [Fimbriimonadaceae bacterium]|nr:hypothetical protein [Fimbriimonadaceae bacterium]